MLTPPSRRAFAATSAPIDRVVERPAAMAPAMPPRWEFGAGRREVSAPTSASAPSLPPLHVLTHLHDPQAQSPRSEPNRERSPHGKLDYPRYDREYDAISRMDRARDESSPPPHPFGHGPATEPRRPAADIEMASDTFKVGVAPNEWHASRDPARSKMSISASAARGRSMAPPSSSSAHMPIPPSRSHSDDFDPDDDDDYPLNSNSNESASSRAARRARRMSNSERGKLYRSRRKEYVETLERKVDQLKREIEQMRLRGRVEGDRALVPTRDFSQASIARIVCDYFSVFEFGVPMPKAMMPGAREALVQSSRQMDFLRQIASPNMLFGKGHTIQMLFEQWQRYSMYHKSLQFTLVDMHVDARGPQITVTANSRVRVRFTRTTIEKVFPHVLWNEELVQQLIGLDVEYPTSNEFVFDRNGKLGRYSVEVDFVGAFVHALGSVPTALQIVGKALIKDQSMIGRVDEEEEVGLDGDVNAVRGSPQRRLETSRDVHSGYASPPRSGVGSVADMAEWQDASRMAAPPRVPQVSRYYPDQARSPEDPRRYVRRDDQDFDDEDTNEYDGYAGSMRSH